MSKSKGEMKNFPCRFSGSIGWAEISEEGSISFVDINRAILRTQGKFVLECYYEDWRYTVSLYRTNDDFFEGEFEARSGGEVTYGKVSCNMVFSDNGGLLFGKWLEEGVDYYCWTNLEQVDFFEDERT